MKFDILHALNAERAARRAVAVVTDAPTADSTIGAPEADRATSLVAPLQNPLSQER